ncbi:MAG: Trehalose/maltose import ATP-binding protein MalK [Methanomassiliicoccales archaeon PtaU1.Bin124]|nr:MAG: Trehalose/maltose import ATP-binding protein MalK [Methanomassiliicoccales archaeon PtaU1.Bin124]
MVENVIEAKNLQRRFGDLVAVNEVSFQVQKGEMFGLLGPNGAGKSTLLKIMTGQLDPSGGECKILGLDPVQDPMAVKKAIGILPEVESPPSFLTGREYLHFVGLVRDMDDIEAKAEKWIEFLDMREVDRIPCKDLSKGTRQKLMFAAALIHEPPLVFLDEPFSGLDPRYQNIFRNYLGEYLQRGGTVFMCTHILEIAEKMCTRLGVISQGRLVAQGSPSEITGAGESLNDAFMRLTEKDQGSAP